MLQTNLVLYQKMVLVQRGAAEGCASQKKGQGEWLTVSLGKHCNREWENTGMECGTAGDTAGEASGGWQTKELLKSCQSQLQREPEREVKDKSREL